MNTFSCEVLYQHSGTKARVTRVVTPHGEFITPVFMPVGTRAGVNNMMPSELSAAGTQIILGGNTYHMLCAPGMEVIENAGGMHRFMGWHGPMLTDSGGFQVFSLSKNKEICSIDEFGAHFKLPGSKGIIHMTPEMSLETQKIIGADIIMAFDQCTPDSCSKDEVSQIMLRTHRWLKQSIDYHQQYPNSRYGYKQALFGIVQGGVFQDLRRESADFVSAMNTDGIAIGGETVGFDMNTTVEVIRWVHEYLPDNKPRYTMGVGMSPQDLLDVVAEGIDMFDCVAPTRNARHGALYCGKLVREGNWLKFQSEHENERIQIKKSCFADDLAPVMESCSCYTCLNYSRSCLHHLSKQKANLFTALASIHNVHVLHDVCNQMRHLIINS
ncbi:tRNA guanosine(34) transglycosylase Tgt [Legionella sp. PATHC032]|uniref:tRNA guanosine(34) transglycosylase Tgt n=1 Tax=Legionella sp. PATHC032 TaxID=2992039 RepID=UPI001B08A868|nr:tRNA guanosine(34) transglycosylase Tgt [Legionella sp. PATHC032]MCW8422669.1 tRNA guanosine(34) transglycosylase Tgt [Legionella sp. PATHC032]HAZ7572470.1 tRNA guanosine(34) transglycosylase Tgt [Legionella pneumophila]HBA1635607.1 tRNA guanosine(34) transglycosylase Tgt [Legionella pneumophila]